MPHARNLKPSLRPQSAHTRCTYPLLPGVHDPARSCPAGHPCIFCVVKAYTRTPCQHPPAESRATRSSRKRYFCFTHRACSAWIPVVNCTECLPINTVVACGRCATIRSFPLTNPTRRARCAHTLRCFVWGCTLVMRGGITFERCTPKRDHRGKHGGER